MDRLFRRAGNKFQRAALAGAALAVVPWLAGCNSWQYLGSGVLAFYGAATLDLLQWPFRSLVGTLTLQAINTLGI